MNCKWAWVGVMTTLVMGPWSFGMAQDRPVIRAQGGVVYPESAEVIYGDDYYEECEDDDCSPFRKVRDCWTYVFTLGGKRRCPPGPGAGAPGYGRYGAGGAGDPRQLDYRYLYRYRAPQNLRYPAANQPAGVVAYPYYTVKGPDDFFLKETLTD